MSALSRRSFLGAGAGAGAAFVGLSTIDVTPAWADPPVTGVVRDQGGQVFDVKHPAYGAKGNTVIGLSGSIMGGSKIFSSGAATFVSTDVGKVITVQGAGVAAGVLSTTIVTYLGPTSVMLADAAATGVNGKEFAFGTDDTQAIVAAVAAAGGRGRLYVPVGIYMIRGLSNSGGPIEIAGSGGMLGAGGSGSNAQLGNTVFLCGDATAGILANGSGTYESFQCHGNNIGVAPLQNGSVVDGVAVGDSRGATFIAVWSFNSAGNGWTIRGAQRNSYYGCRARNNRGPGFSIDGGAGDLHFFWPHAVNNYIDIVSDKVVPGGPGTYGDHTEDVRFSGGICDSSGGDAVRPAKVKLRGATNWTFAAMAIVGTSGITGPTVDLDQSDGHGIDFAGRLIFCRGQNPGIRVSSAPPVGAPRRTFVITDDVKFIGNNSVTVDTAGSYRYSARGWMVDHPPRGSVGGPAIDTLFTGRTGTWVAPTVATGWNTQARYRINSDGCTQLKGNPTYTGAGPSGAVFTLQPGYRPSQLVTIPAAHSTGVGYITVAPDGVVSAPNVAPNAVLFLDGITFPRAEAA